MSDFYLGMCCYVPPFLLIPSFGHEKQSNMSCLVTHPSLLCVSWWPLESGFGPSWDVHEAGTRPTMPKTSPQTKCNTVSWHVNVGALHEQTGQVWVFLMCVAEAMASSFPPYSENNHSCIFHHSRVTLLGSTLMYSSPVMPWTLDPIWDLLWHSMTQETHDA